MEFHCEGCGVDIVKLSRNRRYCSDTCKRRHHRMVNKGREGPVLSHDCRMCGKTFPIGPGQGNKWLCSDECRRASNAKSAREFYKRQPEAEAIYRARTKAKRLPDGNLVRFRRWNHNAPTACESCGEDRVLDMAHKPGHNRFGAHRSRDNCQWPEHVWVLCPTCHALLDRMNYPPDELGLS